jgi:hypothetical protein
MKTIGSVMNSKPRKSVKIAGIKFEYRTPSGLLKKIWSRATNMSSEIRALDERREELLKAYRHLDWKQQLHEYLKQEENQN